MKRIGILTAGGDTPALNATIHGAVTRASQRKIEVFGFIKGFSSSTVSVIFAVQTAAGASVCVACGGRAGLARCASTGGSCSDG